MEFQDLFDELEHKFSAPSNDWTENVNCLKLQTIDRHSVELLAPIIGIDFVAGLERDLADWLCFANRQIASLTPARDQDRELPTIRKQEIRLVDFIKTLERPVRVTVKYQNQAEASFNLLDTDERFLIVEGQALIPAAAINQLRVLGTNSWQ